MTLDELNQRFPTEDAAREHLAKLRWPEGKVHCPRCGLSLKVYKTKAPWKWTCKHCSRNGYRFSLTTGTIFEDTKYPIRTWFQVLFLMLNAKKGKSALEIQRDVFKEGSSYETVWYMCHRLRAAMKNDEFRQLMGVVEVDETFLGGKEGNRHVGKRRGRGIGVKGKAAVIGAIARKGSVVAQVIERTDAHTLGTFVRDAVSPKVELVATDEKPGYQAAIHFPHGTVNHRNDEYVRGVVHTQNIESFWSLLKRGVMGNFHQVSKDYLPLYLAEFTFRHNHRQDPGKFDTVLESC